MVDIRPRGCDADRTGSCRARTKCAARVERVSVEDKIRVRIYVRDLAHHEEFLPTGSDNLAKKLSDAVFFYLGDELEWDVELAIPSGAIEPVKLGKSGRLGWTTWMAPNWTSREPYRYDARLARPTDCGLDKRLDGRPPTRAHSKSQPLI